MVNLKAYTLDQLNNYHLAIVGVLHYLPTSRLVGYEEDAVITAAREKFETSFPSNKYAHSRCSVTIPIGVKLVAKRYKNDFVQASLSCFNLENYEVYPSSTKDLEAYESDPETNLEVFQEDFPLLVFGNSGAFYPKTNTNKPAFEFILENSHLASERTFTLNFLYRLGLFHSTYSCAEHRVGLEGEAQPTFFLKHFGKCRVPQDNNYLFGALNADYTFSYLFCQDNPKYVY